MGCVEQQSTNGASVKIQKQTENKDTEEDGDFFYQKSLILNKQQMLQF